MHGSVGWFLYRLRFLSRSSQRGPGTSFCPACVTLQATLFPNRLRGTDAKGNSAAHRVPLFQLWLEAAGERIMVDQEVIGNQLKTNRFPFQSEGDITLPSATRTTHLGR